MRRHLIVALLVPVLARAGVPKADKKPKPIDVKPVAAKLIAFHDDLGNIYITPGPDAFEAVDEAAPWVFFGDGKTMYQQRIIGSSSQPGSHYEWYLWAPRARNVNTAQMRIVQDQMTIQCAQKDPPRKLTELKADELKTLLAKATFYPPLWQRQARLLARDDEGIYYFVDELREDFGGNGYRIYVGMKGSMKELAMTNMASDSAGEIYATKSGLLKIIAGGDSKAFWIHGDKKIELTMLEPTDNRYLIYRELGIYGQLGAVCEDL